MWSGAALLIAAALGSSRTAAAESPAGAEERPLVVVSSHVDAEAVRRLAGAVLEVRRLEVGESSGSGGDDVRACRDAASLRSFRLAILSAVEECPREAFWLDRLQAVGANGAVRRVGGRDAAAADPRERAMRRAFELHASLVELAPRRRATFDANLDAELRRLSGPSFLPVQLVDSDETPVGEPSRR